MFSPDSAQDLVYDPALDVVACSSEQFRLDLRNFRPIEQSDLKILEELDSYEHCEMRDLLNNNNADADGNSASELPWEGTDMKPDLVTLTSMGSAGWKPIDWLHGAGLRPQTSVSQACSSEPTLMELSLHANEPMFTTLPTCPEVDEELFGGLDSGNHVLAFPCYPVQATKCEPAASTLRSLLDSRENADSDSHSEASAEPRGRAWSFNTNASGRSTATSGVFEQEPSRSWSSQSSAERHRRPPARTRNISTDSTCSESVSVASSDSDTRRVSRSAGSSSGKRGSKAFWHQRDVKARNNLLPVPKLADRAFEADYELPNPKRLLQLGAEINKLSEVLHSVPQPSSVTDDDDKLTTKREKNKFASR